MDHLGIPAFDWADGDGINPFIGPTLTAAGSPNAGIATPWTGCDGSDITATEFDESAGYTTVEKLDPSSGDDVRILALVRHVLDGDTAIRRIFSTRSSGPGYSIYSKASNKSATIVVVDDMGSISRTFNVLAGWFFFDGYWDLDGNLVFKVNNQSSSIAAPGGDHAPGDGIGLGSLPDGTGKYLGDIARVMAWYGSGLSNATDHAHILAHVFGIQNVQERGRPTFARSSSAIKKVDTRYHVFDKDTPRAGSSEGLLIEGQRINKVYNNINPQVTTGWSVTGGGGTPATLAVADDSVNLGANLREAGPNVLKLDNSAGDAAAYAYGGALTGNTNAHSALVFARYTGTQPELGVRDSSGGGFTKWADVLDAYALTKIANQTPGDVDEQFCIHAPVGTVVYFTLSHLEESTINTSPIPNLATAATATRIRDQLTTTHDPRDAEGSVEAGLTPFWWSEAEPSGATAYIVERSGFVGSLLLYYGISAKIYRISDGTQAIGVVANPSDGIRQLVRSRWGYRGLSVDVDGVRGKAAYDGDLKGSGFVQLYTTAPGPGFLIDSFRIYRGESG